MYKRQIYITQLALSVAYLNTAYNSKCFSARFARLNTFFSSHLNIRGLRKGLEKFVKGVLESPGKVLDFFVSNRVGTLHQSSHKYNLLRQSNNKSTKATDAYNKKTIKPSCR